MFQYLPHRRRLRDEPNQVHPPATPTALERKHQVDARQQLRPQRTPWLGYVAPSTTRRVFDRGPLLPATSFRPARAVTYACHGEFGASITQLHYGDSARRMQFYKKNYALQGQGLRRI